MSGLATPLRTARLVLREFDLDDWVAVREYASDPEFVRYMFYEARDEADSRAYVERAVAAQSEVPRRTYELAITLGNCGQFIGACDLTLESDEEADLGYSLARSAWGNGYATEAALALVVAGFDELGLRRIFATVALGNHASARVLQKAGLRPSRVIRRYRHAKGHWWDMRLFEVTVSDWRAGR